MKRERRGNPQRTARRALTRVSAGLATVILVFALQAAAQPGPGGHGGHGGRGGHGRGPHGGAPPIDDACASQCLETHRTCMDSVRAAAESCKQTAGCEEQSAAVRANCSRSSHGDDACVAARDALRACSGGCGETARADADTCRASNRDCLTASCGLAPDNAGRRPGRFQRPDQPSLGS